MSSEHTSAAAAEAKFYVYVHVKADDGEPFYVGKGSGKRAWSTRSRSAWWKRIVAKHGLVVKIQKHFQDESEAFASEIETIAILRDLGYELCNLTRGGEGASGFKHTGESREKISERNRQRWADTDLRAAQANRIRRWATSPEVLARFYGETNPSAKLSNEACRQIFRLRAEGTTLSKIAVQLGCSNTQVRHILSGKSRRKIYLEFFPEPC